MSGVNRYFQRKRFAEFQPLSMQEMAYPYEKQEQKQRENDALSMKLADMQLPINSLAEDNPYRQQIANQFQSRKDELLKTATSPNANPRDVTKGYIELLSERNNILSGDAKILADRMAAKQAWQKRVMDAENLTEADRSALLKSGIVYPYSGSNDVYEGMSLPSFVDSYLLENDIKKIKDLTSSVGEEVSNYGIQAINEARKNGTDILTYLEKSGKSAVKFKQAILPILNDTERAAGLSQYYQLHLANNPNNPYSSFTEYKKAKDNELLNTVATYQTSESNVERLKIEDPGTIETLKNADSTVMGIRTIGANIDNTTIFDIYNTITGAEKQLTELQRQLSTTTDDRAKMELQKSINELSSEVAYWNQNKDEITKKIQTSETMDFMDRFKNYNLQDVSHIWDLENQALDKVKQYGLSELPYNLENTKDRESSVTARNIEYAKALEKYMDSGMDLNSANKAALQDVSAMSNANSKISRYIDASAKESTEEYWLKHRMKLENSLLNKEKNLEEFISKNSNLFAKEVTVLNPVGSAKTLLKSYNDELSSMAQNNPESFYIKGTGMTLDSYLNKEFPSGKIEIDGEDYILTGETQSETTTSNGITRIGLIGKTKDGNTRVVKSVLARPDERVSNLQRQVADELLNSPNPDNRALGVELISNLQFSDEYNHSNLLNAKPGDRIETQIKIGNDEVAFEKTDNGTYKILLNGEPFIYTNANNQTMGEFGYNELNKVIYSLSL